MPIHDLYPGYARVEYHSAYGKHNCIIPTRAWSSTNITGTMGSYTAWDGGSLDAEATFDTFVALLKAFHLATTFIDNITVYTIDAPGDNALPRKAKNYGTAGTNTATTQAKATQQTWFGRDTAFQPWKLVILDAPIGTGFLPNSDFSAPPEVAALLTFITDTNNFWSSRAGNRPAVGERITYTLNKKLRREYGMG